MGFVKLSEELPEWAWYCDNDTLAVYIRLMIGAVWSDTDYRNVRLKRGQIATTLPKIAEQSGLSVQQTRTIIDRLKSTGKITVKTTSKFRIITLLDYDCCDEINSHNNSLSTGKQQASNSPTLLETDDHIIRITDNTSARGSEKIAEKSSEKPKKQPSKELEKIQFAEFVSLTNEEFSSLTEKLGEQGAKRCIEILDNYKGASGRSYKSDYRAILNWVVERYRQEDPKARDASGQGGSSFEVDEVMKKIIGRYSS